ncbi:MAG: menaquinone-specific isochorismate synthase [Psychromonas sp.]|jgi:menaquinone-specific isochorismate synthase
MSTTLYKDPTSFADEFFKINLLWHQCLLKNWYATVFQGYLRVEKSDFSVAIRSALLSSNKIKLFAGAGIVIGSIADQEWQELENKIHTISDILSV